MTEYKPLKKKIYDKLTFFEEYPKDVRSAVMGCLNDNQGRGLEYWFPVFFEEEEEE